LVDIGIREFIFVIGYLGDKIRDYVESRYAHLSTEFVYQDERLGLGHAIWVARHAFEKCDEILIVLGDTIFDGDLKDILRAPNSCLGVKKVEDPRIGRGCLGGRWLYKASSRKTKDSQIEYGFGGNL
jgi:glucose-1-phosphate thymidylyltransferase